ncbi:MAG: hypothetical protein IKT06_01310 [Aeriscardovia sp.]|nr:hypothetical protein [Aeriscardovia sp.]
MKPKRTDLTRTNQRLNAQPPFLAPLELRECVAGLRGGRFDSLPPSLVGKAVRFCISLLREKCPGESIEVRVVPFAACKVLSGSKSDPHNLMPPDFLEVGPEAFLDLSFGLKGWEEIERGLNFPPFSRAKELEPFFPLLSPKK